MNESNLALRISKLEEIEKNKELRADRFPASGLPVFDLEAVVALFADDAEVEYLGLGSAKGIDEIRAFYSNDPVKNHFYCMVPAQVRVNDDLETGTGRWYLLETMRAYSFETGKNEAVWCECAYNDEYVKVADVWKFQKFHCEIRMLVTHEEGWGDKMIDVEQFFAGWQQKMKE